MRLKVFNILVIVFIVVFGKSVYAETNYVLDVDGSKRIPVPLTYEVKNIIQPVSNNSTLMRDAQDLFIDRQNFIYVADTGNNRILKLSHEGNFLKVFSGSEDSPLKKPEGIFVDNDGDLYIADTGNSRILHLDPEGGFVEEFFKPETEMLENTGFSPGKVCMNSIGSLYVLRHNSLMIIDGYGDFRGYVGATRVKFNLIEYIGRTFATKEQKEQLLDLIPSAYTSFTVANDGMIYAATTEYGQMRKLNDTGKNSFKEKFYGEAADDEGNPIEPYFSDIVLDQYGIITVLERNTRKIYQYDQEGNLLTVFGGRGNWKGAFASVNSLAVDSEGRIFVLDGVENDIQVFEPTRFMKLVHSALLLYYEGKYQEALNIWNEVRMIHSGYPMSNKGIAKALLKQGQYSEAMERYKMAGDKEGYSQAFGFHLHQLYRKYFVYIVLSVAISALILIYAVRYGRLTSRQFLNL
jgi:DNA-binding beta-propeller fold protein YncE